MGTELGWRPTNKVDWCGEHQDFPEWRRREREAVYQKRQVERKHAEEGFTFAKTDDPELREAMAAVRKDVGSIADMYIGSDGEAFWKDWIIQECFLRGYWHGKGGSKWPLGINSEMDEHAIANGLAHWSCTDEMGNAHWIRKDGLRYEPHFRLPGGYVDELKAIDKEKQLGKEIAE